MFSLCSLIRYTMLRRQFCNPEMADLFHCAICTNIAIRPFTHGGPKDKRCNKFFCEEHIRQSIKNSDKCPTGYCKVPVNEHSLVSLNITPLMEVYLRLEVKCMACGTKRLLRDYEKHAKEECSDWPGECAISKLVPTEQDDANVYATMSPGDVDNTSGESTSRMFRILRGKRVVRPVELRGHVKVTRLFDEVSRRTGLSRDRFKLMTFRARTIRSSDTISVGECFGRKTTISVVTPEVAERLNNEEVLFNFQLPQRPDPVHHTSPEDWDDNTIGEWGNGSTSSPITLT